ncbi:MAG TPA: hypothetical protein VN892_11280 [Solirubrobacteraceae bacterium]|nr:hypothetical protein [Solirubrobacteraceae bacterium]
MMIAAAAMAIVAMGAITATAFAEAPEFLPGTAGQKYTGSNGEAILATEKKGTIECKTNKETGEVTGTNHKEGIITIDFETCKAFAIIGAHSLGDKENIILVHGTTLLCTINTSPLEVGIVIHPEEVHIEVAGKLLLVKGWVIGKISGSGKSYTTNFEQSSTGVQKIKNCVSNSGTKEKEETLLTSEGTGTPEKSSQTGKGPIGFEVSQELMS